MTLASSSCCVRVLIVAKMQICFVCLDVYKIATTTLIGRKKEKNEKCLKMHGGF